MWQAMWLVFCKCTMSLDPHNHREWELLLWFPVSLSFLCATASRWVSAYSRLTVWWGNQRDIVWWEAFVTWRALNKSCVLDFVVHYVIANNPSGFSWLSLPRLQIRWWSKPCCLLFSAHTFPLDDFIYLMIPITIYPPDVWMDPECVRDSSWML